MEPIKTILSRKPYFRCADRKNRKVTDCLVRGRPTEDYWSVKFVLNGVPYETPKGRWKESIELMRDVLIVNGVKDAELIAGTSCNYDWLIKSKKENQLVDPETLLNSSELVNLTITQGVVTVEKEEREFKSPDFWGAIDWQYMGMELGFDDVTVSSFKSLINREARKLNPALNPSRGCETCYGHWLEAIKGYNHTVTTVDGARKWLWETHNEVNKREGKEIFSWDDAVKQYGWD